ncbi:unnamed protein product [Parajaminaea phylloscopi]
MKSFIAAAATAAVVATTAAQAALVEQWWNVEWVNDVNPTGMQPRRVIGVNGTWPPPLININASDTFKIHVTNKLDAGRGTALHSHGMFFNGTNYYDGAASITQCLIPNDQTYTYEVLNSPKSPNGTQKQWGTFWTHAHWMGQYVDGLRTASIIHPDTPATEAYKVDGDYTVVMSDWYNTEHDELAKEFMNSKNPTGAEPVPDSSLIYFARTPNTAGDAAVLPGYNEDAVMPFQAGKTYRIRLINMSALAMFQFWIDGHDMRIVEADGVDTKEYPIDRITLSVAQRYSILVTAKNDTSQNWKMHANMDPSMFDAVPEDLKLNVTATVQYDSSKDAKVGPEETRDYDTMIDDSLLVPFYPEPAAAPDVSHDLNVWFDVRADGINYAAFNNVTFVMPQTPTLYTALSMTNETKNPAIYGPDSQALVTKHLDMVQVVIYNWDANPHPFHLHGHQFQLVKKTMDVLSTDPEVNPPLNETALALGNPMRRDTVTVPSGGAAYLRFRSDNPGAWLLHCHIDFHLTAGLALVVIESPEFIDSRNRPGLEASASQSFCAARGISTTGNAGGKNSTTDFGTLPRSVGFLVTGWTGAAIGSVVGCAITALLGLLTVVYYGMGKREEDDDDGQDESGDDESR